MLKYVLHPSRLYITIWFVLNVILTLLNKSVMEFSKFRFPITISFIHMAISTILSYIMTKFFKYNPGSGKLTEIQERTDYEKTIMTRIVMLSFLFSLNIIVGNVSLKHCSVAFVQVVRAVIPMLTMLLSVIFLRSQYTRYHYASCVVVCIGVGFSCFGEMNLTTFGLCMTILVCFLSAMKSIAVKLSLTGAYELHSFDLLQRISPIAAIEMFILIIISGEYKEILNSEKYQPTFWGIASVLLTGVIAFVLNLTNFLATFHTSPLTVTIAGCVKQVLTIVLSVIIFKKNMTFLNSLGVAVTTAGSLWYGLLKINKTTKPLSRKQQMLNVL